MKIIFIITALFLIIYLGVSGQTEWAPIGAEWYYSVPDDSGNPLFDFERYVSKRDTIIEGKTCRVIESQNFKEVMYMEDNKVYYRYGNDFKLIYDFHACVSDTIIFDFKSYTPGAYEEVDTTYKVKCIVQTIDTTLIDSTEIRTYTTRILKNDSLNHLVWNGSYVYQERIGFSPQFMYVLSPPSLGFMHNLRCYKDDDINFTNDWWINASQEKDCDYTLTNSAIENNLINEELIFFPNPVSNEIIVKIPWQKRNENYRISIYDNNGQNVQNSTLHNDQQTIDLTGLPKGVYYISLITCDLFYKPFKIIKL